MEKSFLFIQNQKWDSNLDCELQVSVQAANKWHIMNNLGRSLTILAVPWILSAVLLSATLALVYKYYWHLGIPNFSLVFFFFLLLLLQDVSCFCEGLEHVHCPILTDVAHLFPQLGNNIPQCGSLKICLLLPKLSCSLLRAGNVTSCVSLLLLLFPHFQKMWHLLRERW